MKKIVIALLFCSTLTAVSQTGQFFKGPDNLTFYYRDTAAWSQVTIAEYPRFLAVFELPFNDKGAGQATVLQQDLVTAARFEKDVEAHFHKPVRYIFSTHWHQHSLSALSPFLLKGAELFTSASSWQYLLEHGFMSRDSTWYFSKQVHQVRKDTMVQDKNGLQVKILFLDTSYHNKPTRDYLFFYLPGSKMMIGSCMCAVSNIDPAKSPVYSDRLIDLHRSVADRKLNVTTVIALGKKEAKDFLPVYDFVELKAYMTAAKPLAFFSGQYTGMKAAFIYAKMDSLLHSAILAKAPSGAINSAVYTCLKSGRAKDAMAIAHLLNLYSPGVDSYIDTMGEASLAAGDEAAAEKYNALLVKRYPDFKNGGIAIWREHVKSGWK